MSCFVQKRSCTLELPTAQDLPGLVRANLSLGFEPNRLAPAQPFRGAAPRPIRGSGLAASARTAGQLHNRPEIYWLFPKVKSLGSPLQGIAAATFQQRRRYRARLAQ